MTHSNLWFSCAASHTSHKKGTVDISVDKVAFQPYEDPQVNQNFFQSEQELQHCN